MLHALRRLPLDPLHARVSVRPVLLLLALSGFSLAGCAIPVVISGDGEKHSLIVLDSVFTHPVYGINMRYAVEEATIASTPNIDDKVAGQRVDDFLVYADVEPGTYIPRTMKARTGLITNAQKLNAYFPLRVLEDQHYRTVEPGEILFMGRYYVYDGTGQYLPSKKAFQHLWDPYREIDAWEALLEESPRNPWAEKMKERLSLLRELARQAKEEL